MKISTSNYGNCLSLETSIGQVEPSLEVDVLRKLIWVSYKESERCQVDFYNEHQHLIY